MRLPVIPMAVVTVLGAAGAYYFLSSGPSQSLSLAPPELNMLVDLDGVETAIAVAPDESRAAVIAAGEVWIVELGSGERRRLTVTPELDETAPAWTPDGATITVTRAGDSYVIDPETGESRLHLEDAAELEHSGEGRIAFVRGRALWIGEPGLTTVAERVPAEPDSTLTIRGPRFSPDGSRVLFLKSAMDGTGQVWAVDMNGGDAYPVVSDRASEAPHSAEWVGNQQLVYLTDRAGGLAVWHVDLERKTFIPTTPPLMSHALAALRIDAIGNRVYLPRHFFDADIVDSTGARLAATANLEIDPAASADGSRIAWSVINEGRSEVWSAAADGANPVYVGLGQHPRLSPDGEEVVYGRLDLAGNIDVWKSHIDSGLPTRLTDSPDLDDAPDWSPDGSSILFASRSGGSWSIWQIPAGGGRRLRILPAGYGPRYSPDGRQVAYWSDGAVWTATDGESRRAGDAIFPVRPAWGLEGPIWSGSAAIGAPTPPWSTFDRFPDGRWLASVLEIDRTEIWTLELKFASTPES